MTATCANPSCAVEFEPKRRHQKYHSAACRTAAYALHPRAAGTTAQVKTVRVLKSGRVAAVVHFDECERERALRLTPGQRVSMVNAVD